MPHAFPLLGEADFEQGGARLLQRFQQARSMQGEWLSLDTVCQHGTTLLRITRPLTRGADGGASGSRDLTEEGHAEAAEDDEVGFMCIVSGRGHTLIETG